MSDVFESVLGQPRVRDYLRRCVRTGRLSQAYLFFGPAGSNKTQAAFALAAALLCERGGCGECDSCRKVMRRKHPDVRLLSPEGADGYLIEQVRSVVAESQLAPIQAKRKVYIVDRADRMPAAPANAFLKTLEEPPADVVFILLARTRESVLATIASRCQAVPFRHIPASEAAAILAQNTGAPVDEARMALEACGGSVARAVEFLRSNERLAFRRSVLASMTGLERCDGWDIVGRARDLVALAQAPRDEVRAQQEQELARNADFLAKSAIRQLEARNKRALSAKSQESLRQMIDIMASFLRDMLMVRAGAPELVINVDVRQDIDQAARATDEARIGRAFFAVRRCAGAISYNVSPETCIDALLFEMKEALYGSNSTS